MHVVRNGKNKVESVPILIHVLLSNDRVGLAHKLVNIDELTKHPEIGHFVVQALAVHIKEFFERNGYTLMDAVLGSIMIGVPHEGHDARGKDLHEPRYAEMGLTTDLLYAIHNDMYSAKKAYEALVAEAQEKYNWSP